MIAHHLTAPLSTAALTAATLAFAVWGGGAAAQQACSSASIGDAAFECTCEAGLPSGSVWGSGPYTSDSSICAAAVHAGVIGKEGGLVRVMPAPGMDSYEGTLANGIETRSWGSYGSSFEFMTAAAMTSEECGSFPSGSESYTCSCAANSGTGSVWGSGPYTSDSSICTAAIHAGVLSTAGGEVTVYQVPGLDGYSGSTANGVTTRDWGSYGESFIIDANN